MLVSLIKDGKIEHFSLPKRVYGNYWVTDDQDGVNEHNLINIEARDHHWVLIGNDEIQIMDQKQVIPSIVLKEYCFYVLYSVQEKQYFLLYSSLFNDWNPVYLDCSHQSQITIGNTNDCLIRYQTPFLSSIAAVLKYENYQFVIYDQESKWGIYVNDQRISHYQRLNSGDVIFLMGFKMIVMQGDRPFLVINNPNQAVTYSSEQFPAYVKQDAEPFKAEENLEATLYQEQDYFYKKPRFRTTIQPLLIEVDPPPTKAKMEDRPLLLTLGPMLTMGMTSLVIAFTTINNIQTGRTTWINSLPSLVMAFAMLGTMLLWPMLTKRYEKKKKQEEEALRQKKYSAYIEEKRGRIISAVQEQRRILLENNVSLKECQDIILQKKFSLWERKKEEEDFLSVSFGTGSIPMSISIRYPEAHFSVEEDNLKELVSRLGEEPKNLVDVPIVINLYQKYLVALIGRDALTHSFLNRLLLQLVTFHSYDDLKLVLLTNKTHESAWDYLKILPHNWSNDHKIRYFGTTIDEIREICYYLEHDLMERNEKESWKQQRGIPYYLIVTDSFPMIRNVDFISSLLKQGTNQGFGFLLLNDRVSNLPSECQMFVNVNESHSELFENVLNGNVQKFQIDFDTPLDFDRCSQVLANIPIEFLAKEEGNFPKQYTFLEMYDVGKIEQLNPLNRWQKSNPIQTLQAPVGIGKDGQKISLDLHEKFHGPHGLIAGMTGSGKSEFLITYILSMAVQYHPYEVQFILIDYKGGGLAGAFEKKELNIKLPHLVGTITNLDANEIQRSLLSIESELKRRQKAFNHAREVSHDSTIDIYKYQKLYREGILEEPISHLFIISDEFAELKKQEPEFMQQLISTARIGRSLGVHLILATQKPSGIVDNQIWSNTRFRVCFRVQEKSDSTEVIKRPDAALLKNTGRFYFQVGYNEIFMLGQAAWCGAPYYPSEKRKKKVDTSLELIDNIGFVIKSINDDMGKQIRPSQGEELTNLVAYLDAIAKEEQLAITPLWLNRIPNEIYVAELEQKYQYVSSPTQLISVIGEYDVPSAQEQHLFTLNLAKNTLVYGNAESGIENFLVTMLYGCIRFYSPKKVNLYLLDFGTESLQMFLESPQVGDFIYRNETEKLDRFFKFLFHLMEERKARFTDYNGNYEDFLQMSPESLPRIVVVLNHYEAFAETYDQYFDSFQQLTRDGLRYGISFVVTVSNPSGIRLRLKQNFGQEYALQQNNETDYTTIFGNVHKKYPSKNTGRGILKLDDIYEFQTALVAPPKQIASLIRNVCKQLKEQYPSKAPSIPVLPDIISFLDLNQNQLLSNRLLIGMETETFELVSYPFEKHVADLITGLDVTMLVPFMKLLIQQLLYHQTKNLFVIQAEEVDWNFDPSGFVFADQRFDAIFERLLSRVDAYEEAYQTASYDRTIFKSEAPIYCLILGIDSFRNKLSSENRMKFGSFFEKAQRFGMFHFLFFDRIDKIKKLEVESWYRTVINNRQGIWFGSGFADQFSLKVNKITKTMREEIPDNFCYVIQNGKAQLVKAIDQFESIHEVEVIDL